MRRAHTQAGFRKPTSSSRAHGQGDPEVRDQGSPLVNQDVGGLDVSVDDFVPMSVVERLGQVRRDLHRFIHRKLLLAVDALPERFPFDVGHHVEEEAVRLARIEQRQDVRVSEVRGGLDLRKEAFGTHHRSQIGLQNLESYVAVVLQILGEIHRSHPTFTQLTLYLVAAFQGSVQARDGIGH